MASKNKSPWDICNKHHNDLKDILANLLSQRTDPPRQHKDAPQHIRLHPGPAPFIRQINSLTDQRWINTYEYNAETETTHEKHYDARYNSRNWRFNKDTYFICTYPSTYHVGVFNLQARWPKY